MAGRPEQKRIGPVDQALFQYPLVLCWLNPFRSSLLLHFAFDEVRSACLLDIGVRAFARRRFCFKDGPDQRGEPAENRPAKKKIDPQNTGTVFRPADERYDERQNVDSQAGQDRRWD